MPGTMNNAHSQQCQKDLEQSNSPARFVRASVSRLPNSVSAKAKVNLPLGIILQPLAPCGPGEEEVQSVNFGAVCSIVRCKSCRTYINPFVQWEANGHRWICNICGFSQPTQDAYYASLDETNKRSDRHQKPELSKGVVEYIAPSEYMVRPPQPPVFMFVIDVSYSSVASGLLQTVIDSIKETIQSGRMPGGARTQVGIMTFDTSLHFYNLNSNLSQPQMLVVADLEDIFLPLPDDILVGMTDNEASIVNLLDSLPGLFAETKINESCLGSAVQAAQLAMKHVGGKMLVFGASIPSVGERCLKSTRDNARLLGTDREVELLRPVSDQYKDLATELTRVQISVELFLGTQAYVDLASITPLAKYTGGDVRYYPAFHCQTQGLKLKNELTHVLTRYMGWESVLRFRMSRGWKITQYFGNLFLRGQDLLVVPNCHADQTFAIAIDMEDNVTPDPVCCVQAALLYTNSDGERRIRVHTWGSLTTPNYNEIAASVDVQATATMLAHQSVDHSLKTTLAEGRKKIQNQAQQVVQTSNTMPNAPEAFQFMPLYFMGMLKCAGFGSNVDVNADMRTFVWSRLSALSVSQMAAYFYPRMVALHNLSGDAGQADENGIVTMPDMLNLTSESMSMDGVYLIEDGESMWMWMGGNVDAGFLQAHFGCNAVGELDPLNAEYQLQALAASSPAAQRVWNVISQVRMERMQPYLHLQVVRQGDPQEAKFFALLIEDRTPGLQCTYVDFLQRLGYRPQQAQAPPQQQALPQQQAPGGYPGAAGGAPPMMGGPPMMSGPPTMMRPTM